MPSLPNTESGHLFRAFSMRDAQPGAAGESAGVPSRLAPGIALSGKVQHAERRRHWLAMLIHGGNDGQSKNSMASVLYAIDPRDEPERPPGAPPPDGGYCHQWLQDSCNPNRDSDGASVETPPWYSDADDFATPEEPDPSLAALVAQTQPQDHP